MSGQPTALTDADTERLTRRGLRLAQFTVVYNVAEGAIAITAGLLAGLVSLVGFGVDSGIESLAAILVGLRLSARLRHGSTDEQKERRALKAVAVTFFVLAAYVAVEGVRSLLDDEEPNTSTVGLVLLAASIVVMPLLARAKRRVGSALGGDPLILADAAETKICVLLSISTLGGLALYALTGAAWLDPVAGFVIAAFAIHEGREAWEGELVEDDGHDLDEEGAGR
ncbi:cation diffusion facilitator family transporter [Blastococcus saxobsidens]|uniref:Cobalt, cadmium, and zinc/H(+)-K(+) antiporter n=1 Tax=Blastococcus saxobsidens (strain DD2) TaxID=1146883 RepID=H6RWX2_BLASD|nr:cation transporter [Blastococcus saxobsidens]CCG02184.1 Cobalt, cadmium, and zinc/H(+)-K(+) antiporter [Blastococcus saxobsidens DD2]